MCIEIKNRHVSGVFIESLKSHPLLCPSVMIMALWVAHRLNCQYQGCWNLGGKKLMEFKCNKTGGNFSARSAREAEEKLKNLRKSMGC
jgi:hypothetical protein